GQGLTAFTGSIADLDGLLGVAFRFRWQSGGPGSVPEDIAGATGPTFTPGPAEVGKAVRVVVSFIDNGFTSEEVISSWSAVVAAAPSDPRIVEPALGAVPAPQHVEAPGSSRLPGRVVRPRPPLRPAALSVPRASR